MNFHKDILIKNLKKTIIKYWNFLHENQNFVIMKPKEEYIEEKGDLEMGVHINSDKEIVKLITDSLELNKIKFGKRYCPCSLEHTDDTVCMCREFREQKVGYCHCGLYYKD